MRWRSRTSLTLALTSVPAAVGAVAFTVPFGHRRRDGECMCGEGEGRGEVEAACYPQVRILRPGSVLKLKKFS